MQAYLLKSEALSKEDGLMNKEKAVKKVKLYNVIFPTWFLMFFPPVILITLLGNFVIDSLVLLACFYAFRLMHLGSFKKFYTASVLKVWLFGFLADAAGAALLFMSQFIIPALGLPHSLEYAINFDPFSHVGGLIIIVIAVLVSGLLIFLFNYRITFNRLIADEVLRFRLALAIAVVTMPWTFLLPTKWWY